MRANNRAALAAIVALGCAAMATASAQVSDAGGSEAPATSAQPSAELRQDIHAWHKLLGSTDAEGDAAREQLTSLTDERAVPVLMELWKKEQSPQRRRYLIKGLESIGTRRAFHELVKVACEDASAVVRTEAAKWIAKQEIRDEAIPVFAKYLKKPKFFRYALTSLGYTEIAKKSKPPDPELVAALIDGLVGVVPERRRVRYGYDSGDIYRPGWRRDRTWGTDDVIVTEFRKVTVPEAKDLLYQYTSQDLGFDQSQWRKHVLRPLQKQKPRGQ